MSDRDRVAALCRVLEDAGDITPTATRLILKALEPKTEHRVQLADYRTPHGHITAYCTGCEWTTTAHMTEATAQAAQHLTTNR